MVKDSVNQKLRLRNFDARDEKIETGAVVKSHKEPIGVEGGKGILLLMERKKASVRRETSAVSSMRETIVQSRHQKPHHPLSHNLPKHEVEVCREKEMSEAEASLKSSIDRRVNTS